MTGKDDRKSAKVGSYLVLWALSLLTIVWIGVTTAPLLWPSIWSSDWLQGFPISSSKLSELNNFLSKTFVTVPLAWLAAAIFIQSRKIREQRKELALTRQEFELAREATQRQTKATQEQIEAAKAQAEAAKAQAKAAEAQAKETQQAAKLFEIQNKILQDEQRIRHEKEHHEILEELLSQLDSAMNFEAKLDIFEKEASAPTNSLRLSFKSLSSAIYSEIKRIEDTKEQGGYIKSEISTEEIIFKIESIILLMKKIMKMTEELSVADRFRISLEDYDSRIEAWLRYIEVYQSAAPPKSS